MHYEIIASAGASASAGYVTSVVKHKSVFALCCSGYREWDGC